ncbi:MAG TPA: competence/damage-inducible protein A [Bacillota bacterium]|nr:competence/damage-inducible protein A [Bacillota bacterium]
MKQANAELISIGTELLLGQIADTNAQWISQQLALYGVNVFHHSVVGDNLYRVERSFRLASDRANIIIVTGGLGPTDDDLTREAFQLISNMEMIEHKPSMEKIQAFFAKQKTVMTPNNRKQARIFKGSKVIPNRYGMAPGMIVPFDGKIWVFLPGVPREMKQMFTDKVIPYIKENVGNDDLIKSRILRFIGIGESQLEHELKDLIDIQDNPTIAPLAQNNGMTIRLTAKGSSEAKVDEMLHKTEQQILERVSAFCYGVNNQTIENTIVDLLKKENIKISSAESLTGGKFMDRLISVPGSSQACRGAIVCYDTQVKTDVLGVSQETIRTKGTVSYECALEMAENVCNLLDADIGVSFTGIAGPDSIEGKPVGTVFIGIVGDGREQVEKFTFHGDRESIRERTVLKGYEQLFHFVKS